VRSLAAALAPDLSADNFRLEPVEKMSFPDGCADFVISSAVLHFAKALQLQPDYVDARYNLASAYVNEGRLDEAIAHLSALPEESQTS
jgi:tetratricopeptide (TPR) repeat protein